MRDICKKASIAIPPSIYRKDSDSKDMEYAISEILKKNGLNENSQKASIMAVKEKLQQQRDLDGIDTGNIINDGPRSRRKAVRYETWEPHLFSFHLFSIEFLCQTCRYVTQQLSSKGDCEEIERFSCGEDGSESESQSVASSDDDQPVVPTSVPVCKRPKLDEWSDDDYSGPSTLLD